MPLHEQSEKFLAAAAAAPTPTWSEISVDEARDIFSGWKDQCGTGPELHSVEDTVLADHVPVRIYRPAASSALPVIMYFHGGGWVLGDLDSHDTVCRSLSSESGSIVVAVHYRRAPEHPFPAALDDCFAATKFVAENSDSLNVDGSRIVVAGDSAGGNLATTVCLRAAREATLKLAGQMLIYPVIAPDFETQSYRDYAEGFGLTRETMMWFWKQYLGSQQPSAFANPLLNNSTAELPPAHVITAEYDVLRTEGIRYANHLRGMGVETTHREYSGVLHGFVHFAGIFDTGHEAISDISNVVKGWVSGNGDAG